MKLRCNNKSAPAFARYGAVGITVCERWNDSFEAFLQDVGPRPSPKHSLDRIDNSGNYEPGNCRWATQIEQIRNSRAVKMVTVLGETMSVADARRKFAPHTPKGTISARLHRGWPIEKALLTPP
jgi:hypothetical protein